MSEVTDVSEWRSQFAGPRVYRDDLPSNDTVTAGFPSVKEVYAPWPQDPVLFRLLGPVVQV